jgi:hypothetical protein
MRPRYCVVLADQCVSPVKVDGGMVMSHRRDRGVPIRVSVKQSVQKNDERVIAAGASDRPQF